MLRRSTLFAVMLVMPTCYAMQPTDYQHAMDYCDSSIANFAERVKSFVRQNPEQAQGVVVLFDIDNTIARAANLEARDEWFTITMTRCAKILKRVINTDGKEISELALRYVLLESFPARKTATLKPLEETTTEHRGTVETIRELQELGVTVLGVTAQSVQLRKYTTKQLEVIGIKFGASEETDPWQRKLPKELKLRQTPTDPIPACFYRGCIFCGMNDKGTLTTETLAKLNITPSHVFFLDDSDKNVKKMATALKGRVPAHCVIYHNGGCISDMIVSGSCVRTPQSIIEISQTIQAMREQAENSRIIFTNKGYTIKGEKTFECFDHLMERPRPTARHKGDVNRRAIMKVMSNRASQEPSENPGEKEKMLSSTSDSDTPDRSESTNQKDVELCALSRHVSPGPEQRGTEARHSGLTNQVTSKLSDRCSVFRSHSTPRSVSGEHSSRRPESARPQSRPIDIPQSRSGGSLQVSGRRISHAGTASSAPAAIAYKNRWAARRSSITNFDTMRSDVTSVAGSEPVTSAKIKSSTHTANSKVMATTSGLTATNLSEFKARITALISTQGQMTTGFKTYRDSDGQELSTMHRPIPVPPAIQTKMESPEPATDRTEPTDKRNGVWQTSPTLSAPSPSPNHSGVKPCRPAIQVRA